MAQESFREFIKNEHRKYNNIGHLDCPAFQGEKVYFNEHGFNHLLRKGKVIRNTPQQMRRLQLVGAGVRIVAGTKIYAEYRTVGNHKFWSLEGIVGNKLVTVVICQMPGSEKHFFSVMDRKLPKSTKDP